MMGTKQVILSYHKGHKEQAYIVKTGRCFKGHKARVDP